MHSSSEEELQDMKKFIADSLPQVTIDILLFSLLAAKAALFFTSPRDFQSHQLLAYAATCVSDDVFILIFVLQYICVNVIYYYLIFFFVSGATLFVAEKRRGSFFRAFFDVEEKEQVVGISLCGTERNPPPSDSRQKPPNINASKSAILLLELLLLFPLFNDCRCCKQSSLPTPQHLLQ